MMGARAILCLLAVSRMALATDGPGQALPRGGYGGRNAKSFEDLEALVDGLEADVNSDIVAFSDATTLLAVGDELLNLINDRLVPRINLINDQQDSLIDIGTPQIKDLQHRADEAFSVVTQALTVALDTAAALARQNNTLITVIRATNIRQAGEIDALRDRIEEWQQSILNNIDDEIDYLNDLQDAAQARIDVLQDFVDSRICEYGFTVIPPGEFFVYFKVPFDEPPQVSLTTVGFRGQLDKKSYNEYDTLALDKHVVSVTREGFTVSATDLSAGMVEVDTVYSSYMACQNLDQDVYLPNNPVTRGPPTTKQG